MVAGDSDPVNKTESEHPVERSTSRSSALLSIEDLSVYVKTKQQNQTAANPTDAGKGSPDVGRKYILNNINTHVYSGQTLAIMGGSGAGKTTLLNAMVLEQQRGSEQEGDVILNGTQLTRKKFRLVCGHVAQDDRLFAPLTVSETLHFAANLYQSNRPQSERNVAVDRLLAQTGLSNSKGVLVGDGQLIKGISGGQRRRLSVAIELLKRPYVLVLDEPTTGLDSASAEALVDLLKKVAQDDNIAVVYTIHQPSSYIYLSFDRLLLLAMGRVCFFGAANRALDHFFWLGLASESGVNPAELMIRSTNADFRSKSEVKKICDAWLSTGHAGMQSELESLKQEMVRSDPSFSYLLKAKLEVAEGPVRARSWLQIYRLTIRLLRVNIRCPHAFLGRILCTGLSGAFIAYAYKGARERRQEDVLQMIWFLGWMQVLPAFLCIGAVPLFTEEFLTLRKEVNNGLYSAKCHFLATLLVNIPFWMVLALVGILPPMWILNLNWSNLPQMLVLEFAYIGYSDSFAQICGTLRGGGAIGVMVFLLQAILNMLFTGNFLPNVKSVIWPLRTFFYTSPAKYVFRSGVYLEFEGMEYTGFAECTSPSVPIELRAGMPCWGKYGLDIVQSLSTAIFPVLEAEDTLAFDIGIVVLELVILKIIYMLLLICRFR